MFTTVHMKFLPKGNTIWNRNRSNKNSALDCFLFRSRISMQQGVSLLKVTKHTWNGFLASMLRCFSLQAGPANSSRCARKKSQLLYPPRRKPQTIATPLSFQVAVTVLKLPSTLQSRPRKLVQTVSCFFRII